MGATTGINPILDTTGITTTDALFNALLALIPNPDAPHGSGAVAAPPHGIKNTYLDQMSPGAAAQLRVELLAAKAFANNATVPGS